MLGLQTLTEGVYADGRYGRTIDYARPLDPPLPPGDEARADQLLKAAGRR